MVIFSGSYHAAGLRGLPRRVYSASLAGDSGEAWGGLTQLGAVGGVCLFLSALAFVLVVVGTWVGGRRIEPPVFEFSRALRPPTTLGLWDRFGLWALIAVMLVVAAYAYPLAVLLAHPRYGSPPFQPF
jgi:heme/copper-type cytochrome/quinol oxidase subunit 1